MTEEQDSTARLRALEEKIEAKEAAKKISVSTVIPPNTLADLPPELRILAQRRARYDLGDRDVHREVFGPQVQQMAKGVDFDLW
jgi:hypothetical protein